MKKMTSIAVVSLVLFCSGWVSAGEYSYYFDSYYSAGDDGISDLTSLSHGYFYTWYLEWEIPQDEEIIGASLSFQDLWYDGYSSVDDDLWVNLLNDVPAGNFDGDKDRFSDTVNPNGQQNEFTSESDYWDDFNGAVELAHYNSTYNYGSDAVIPTYNPYGSAYNITYTFESAELTTLIAYVEDGNNFGIGLDSDCHYDLDGVLLKIVTGDSGGGGAENPVPEPTTIFLLGFGLMAYAGFGRKRRQL